MFLRNSLVCSEGEPHQGNNNNYQGRNLCLSVIGTHSGLPAAYCPQRSPNRSLSTAVSQPLIVRSGLIVHIALYNVLIWNLIVCVVEGLNLLPRVLVALLQPSCRVRAAASSWQRPSTTGRCADGLQSQMMSWWRCLGANTAIACMANGISSCATPAAWMRTMTGTATLTALLNGSHGGVVSTASGWDHGLASGRGGLNDTAK